MKRPETTTLMMVTYNRLDHTKRTIDGLKKSVDIPYKFVIVDNNSTDGSVEFLEDFAKQNANVHLIKNSENKGIGVARNQGLAAANDLDTDWYCTIDNDVEMPDGWLSDCIDILKNNAAFGCMGVNMEPNPYPMVEMNGRKFQLKPNGNLGTASLVFNKKLIKLLGSFNIEYGLYGMEDSDFGMRIRVLGLKMGYVEKMGTHFGGNEVVENNPYRQFKTKTHDENLALFHSNCYKYIQHQRPLYIPLRVSK
jgi:GT2 family glycosyltransferase